MRIACLCVPDFPLAAWCRTEPDLCGSSLAVVAGRGPRAQVVARSPEAAERGVAVGLTVAQATAVDSRLLLRSSSPRVEAAAQAALCDVADAFSPRVEEEGSGTVYLDCAGLDAAYGPETGLARALAQRAEQCGLEACVGIASGKIAACLAAHAGSGVAVIPPSEEWSFLSPLPVSLLQPSDVLRETLSRWGVRCIGDLAALPLDAVATRLGAEGVLLARRARGEAERLLVPRAAPSRFEEAVDLDYGVETLEPFLFVLRGMLDRLTARLALRGFCCGDLQLALRLANRGRDERTIEVVAPSNEAKALLALARLDLEARPPSAPIESIRLATVAVHLRPVQLDLYRPSGPAAQQLAVTLARLTALCGPERVGVSVVADSYRPDAYGVKSFELDCAGRDGTTDDACCREELHIALRAVRPPREVEVFCRCGRPDFVRAVSTERREYACTGRVVTRAGPWRVQGEWWHAEGFARDYYDVQLSDGVVYRMFCDLKRRTWFVDGVYD